MVKKEEKQTQVLEKDYTKYEVARIVGARALQVSLGAPVLVKPPKEMSNPIDIAMYEFSKSATPITVKRPYPFRYEE